MYCFPYPTFREVREFQTQTDWTAVQFSSQTCCGSCWDRELTALCSCWYRREVLLRKVCIRGLQTGVFFFNVLHFIYLYMSLCVCIHACVYTHAWMLRCGQAHACCHTYGCWRTYRTQSSPSTTWASRTEFMSPDFSARAFTRWGLSLTSKGIFNYKFKGVAFLISQVFWTAEVSCAGLSWLPTYFSEQSTLATQDEIICLSAWWIFKDETPPLSQTPDWSLKHD